MKEVYNVLMPKKYIFDNMAVDIEYINESQTECFVDYGAKRRARYYYPDIECLTSDKQGLIVELQEFVREEVRTESLNKLTDGKLFSLVERLARRFCGLMSPKKDYGLDKSIIRSCILAVLYYLQSKLTEVTDV